MRRRIAEAVALGAIAVIAMTGCAAPEGSEARPVDSDIAELLSPTTTPSPVETLPPRPVSVTWVRGNKLEPVGRLVSAASREQLLDTALLELSFGPRPTEQTQGYRTSLPSDVVFEGTIRRARASVDLQLTTPTEPGGVELAVGQIATTALAIKGVNTVVFSVDGQPERVPVPTRNRDVRVVRATDFRSLLR